MSDHGLDLPARFVSAFRNPSNRGAYCRLHGHEHVEIIYHASGSGRTRTETGVEWTFTTGTVVVHRAGERHEQWMDETGVDLCLQVQVLDHRDLADFDSFCLPQVQDPQVRRELASLHTWIPGDDPISRRILDLRASSILLALWRERCEDHEESAGGSSDGWVRRARRAIQRDPVGMGTVSALAQRLGVSADHLRHVFAEVAGTSPKQYILDQRIERVQDLLIHSPATLEEIAAATGFANARQLCSTFRRRTGQTPGDFRGTTRSGPGGR